MFLQFRKADVFASVTFCLNQFVLPASMAFIAWISTQPYFIWTNAHLYYICSSLFATFLFFVFLMRNKPDFSFIKVGIIFLIFIVYISLLPKVDGGHFRWFLLAPFFLIFFLIPENLRSKTSQYFEWGFALSLVPSMIIWILLVIGIHINFTALPGIVFSAIKTQIIYLQTPGAIFINGDAILLPNHGALYRLCGIWSEPGVVGTTTALLLAANNYRMNNIKNYIFLISGLMSCSLAFYFLFVVGVLIKLVQSRNIIFLIHLVIAALAIVFVIYGAEKIKLSYKSGQISPINIVGQQGKHYQHQIFFQHLREPGINNRSSPQLDHLFNLSMQSGVYKFLFGQGADASEKYASGTSSWKQVPIDYGFLGLFILFLAFIYWLYLYSRQRKTTDLIAFSLVFFLSFYQRPIIWLPFLIVIFSSAMIKAEKKENLVINKV